MSQQVNAIQKNENNAQVSDSNRFLACEEIVDELVEQGLPSSFVPENFISKIAKTYSISTQEARTCLKLAIKQLQVPQEEQKEAPEEQVYAKSGYFYPQGYSQNTVSAKAQDGMESLSSLASYNRLMFGLR